MSNLHTPSFEQLTTDKLQGLSRSYSMLAALKTIESLLTDDQDAGDEKTISDKLLTTVVSAIDLTANVIVRTESDLQKHRLSTLQEDLAKRRARIKNLRIQAESLRDVVRLQASELKVSDQIIGWLGGMAIFDDLTGLLNRNGFMAQLNSRHALSEMSNKSYGAIFIDLNNFKIINDTLGHQTGDEVLKRSGRVISDATRQGSDKTFSVRLNDIVARGRQTANANSEDQHDSARIGGDEFVILASLGEVDAPEANELLINKLLERVKNDLQEEFADDERLLDMGFGFSMGIGLFRKGMTSKDVISEADDNMYDDKRNNSRRPRRL